MTRVQHESLLINRRELKEKKKNIAEEGIQRRFSDKETGQQHDVCPYSCRRDQEHSFQSCIVCMKTAEKEEKRYLIR